MVVYVPSDIDGTRGCDFVIERTQGQLAQSLTMGRFNPVIVRHPRSACVLAVRMA